MPDTTNQIDQKSDKIFKLDDFKEYLDSKSKLSETTKRSYYYAVSKFTSKYSDLENLENYNEFLLEFSIKKKRNYLYHYALKYLINFWIEDQTKRNRIKRGLLEVVEKTPIRKRKYLSVSERKRVISFLQNYKHKIIARILLYTGTRIMEILTLKKGDINWEPYAISPGNKIEVMQLNITAKGGDKNPVWVHDRQLQEDIDAFTLNNYIDREYYFLERGKSRKNDLLSDIRTNYHWFWYDLKRALDSCGYEMKDWATHDFRRGVGVDVWEDTKDILTVQRMLRHKRIDTTARYLEHGGLQNKDTSYQIMQNYNSEK